MIEPSRIGGPVIGIGCDLVDIQRMRDMHERHGKRCLEKIFSVAEQKYCLSMRNPYPSLSARFAAKEAVSKAFGCGIGKEFGLLSLSVEKGDRGEPLAVLDELGLTLLRKVGGAEVLLSLTHTSSQAMAFAVIVGDPKHL